MEENNIIKTATLPRGVMVLTVSVVLILMLVLSSFLIVKAIKQDTKTSDKLEELISDKPSTTKRIKTKTDEPETKEEIKTDESETKEDTKTKEVVKPELPTGWLSYTDDRYGYGIAAPLSWHTKYFGATDETFALNPTILDEDTSESAKIKLSVYTTTSQESLIKSLKLDLETPTETTVTANSLEWYQINGSPDSAASIVEISSIITINKRVYKLTLSSKEEELPELIDVYDQMLQTVYFQGN